MIISDARYLSLDTILHPFIIHYASKVSSNVKKCYIYYICNVCWATNEILMALLIGPLS